MTCCSIMRLDLESVWVGEREIVCVCVCDRGRVCGWVRERVSECVRLGECVSEREKRVREREKRERERLRHTPLPMAQGAHPGEPAMSHETSGT